MAGQNLPQGQINPAARPVSDFIRPQQRQLATPAGPPGMPAPQGITTMQSAGMSSYGGTNRFQELAEALAPFNRVLTSTLQTGAEGLASWASKRGEQQAYALNAKNQALQALGTADRTNEAGSFDYAQANRDLARRDPEGGLLMDLLNPYRETGVRRGLSKLAGAEAEVGLNLLYEKFDPNAFGQADRGMGALLKMRSDYTTQLAQRYGLDTSTPGFINHTLPKVNAAWEKVLTRASSDRKDMLKSTMPVLAGAELRELYTSVQSQLQAGATVININGRQYPADNLDLVRGALWQNAALVLDSYGAKMGLPGEVMGLSKAVVADLYKDAAMQDDPAFRMFVQGIEVGPATTDPVSKESKRFRAGELFPTEDYDAQIKYGEHAWKMKERGEEQVFNTFQSQLTVALLGVGAEDYAGRKAIADQQLNEFIQANPNAPLAPALKAVKDLVGVVGDFQSSGFSPDAGNDALSSMRERYGAAWDPVAARNEAQAMLPSIAPDKRGAFLSAVEAIIKQKEAGTSTPFKSSVTRAVESAKAAALAREYGGSQQEALIRGIPGAIESRKANIEEATRRFNQAVYPYVNQQLELEAARLGRPLTEAETGAVAARAAQEYGQKSEQGKADYKRLFPGGAASGAPAVPGASAARPPATTPAGKPAGKPAPPTVGTDRLDDFPGRMQRLRNYQNETILNRSSIDGEMRRLMSGQGFSPQMKRAAMDARAQTPAQFLQQQASRYGIEITEEVMRDLNKRSSTEVTPQRYMAGLLNAGGQALARIGGWALDIATGTQPARAGEMPTQPMAQPITRPGPSPATPKPTPAPVTPAPAPDRPPARATGAPPPAPMLPPPTRPQALPATPYGGGGGGAPARSMDQLFGIPARSSRPPIGQIAMVSGQPRSLFGGGTYDDGSDWSTGPAVAASHPETGAGYTIPGARDEQGRPVVFERNAANAFAAMMRDSGGVVKGSDVASAQRSKWKNDAVDGATGSLHLSGKAMDIHGASNDWIRRNGAKYGWFANDYKGSHGGHFEFRGGRTQRMARRDSGAMVGDVTYYTGSGGSDGVLGGRTANGEVFTGKGMTAAVQWGLKASHMNKWLIVEDVNTGRSVRVWANDTGQMGGTEKRPADRLVDLSPTAFKQLYGSLGRGVGRIRVRIDPNQSGRP